MATVVSSATGLLTLLEESHPALKLHALSNLNKFLDPFCLPCGGSMSEDAALRASKIYYHFDELNKALSYALLAGPLFDASEDFDYVHAILAKAIDEYGILKARAAELNQEAEKVDPRLESFLERMLWKCILDQKYQAIGIAIVKRQHVALVASKMDHELGIFPERYEVFHKTCTKRRRTSNPKEVTTWHRKALQSWRLKSR
ncbi:hypothetical protein MKX03_009324 [Papaver bracteatum]|nr:hypothetical protein MKX03_009324 [Papaver bracteatum]